MTRKHGPTPEHVEELLLVIVNDGKGDQCGYSYEDRLKVARRSPEPFQSAFDWTRMASSAVRWLEKRDDRAEPRRYSSRDILAAALEVAEYYAEHVAESAS